MESVIKPVSERWSPYSFSPLPVSESVLESLFEAARCAPSSMNEQPWIFIYTTKEDHEYFNIFLGFLFESNSIWARNAFALAIILARTRFSRNNEINRHAFYDTGMAVGNLLAQATSVGLFVHQMGGFSVEAVRKYFETGDSLEPLAMMAIGYLGDGSELNDNLKLRDKEQRPRKPVSDFVFKNHLDKKIFLK